MARTNGPIQVWHRGDTIPTDPEGGYAGGDSTAAAVGGAMAQAGQAVATVDNLTATATALPPGATPTVTVTGAVPNKVINIGVPRGEPGMGYEEGQQLLADSQTVKTQAQTAASAAEASATLAGQAQAAALEVPDANVSALIGNPATDTRGALPGAVADIRAEVLAGDPQWSGGVAPSRTRAQNTTALIAALDHGIATGRPVRLPSGKLLINPIDRTGKPDHIVGAGATLTSDNRPTYPSTTYPDLWKGSVLVAPPGLGANEPLLKWGQGGRSDSLRLEDFAVVGTDGSGVGLQLGSEYGVDGGGVPHRSRLKNVCASNFRAGIVTSAENSFWSGLYVVAAEEGLRTQYPFNGNTVAGITVERCTKSAIVVDHSIANIFTGGVLQANTPENGSLVIQSSSLSNTFLNFYMEDYPPAGATSGTTWNEILVGTPGMGTCYGNTLDGFHVGASSLAGTIPRVYLYGQVGTRIFFGHSASTTPVPYVEVGQGRDHWIVGNFVNGIGGAYLSKGYWRDTADTSGAHNFSQPIVAPSFEASSYVRAGSVGSLPSAVTAGAGAMVRDSTYRVPVESDGVGWAPFGSRVSGVSNGASGNIASPPAGWDRRTHIKLTAASGLTLWSAATQPVGRAWCIRNARPSGSLTISVPTGQSMDGTTNGTATIPAGGCMWLVVNATRSGWETY